MSQYEVIAPPSPSGKYGLFFLVSHGQLVVQGFQRDINGNPYPIEQSRRVCPGDVLVSVNGIRLAAMDARDKIQTVLKAGNEATDKNIVFLFEKHLEVTAERAAKLARAQNSTSAAASDIYGPSFASWVSPELENRFIERVQRRMNALGVVRVRT